MNGLFRSVLPAKCLTLTIVIIALLLSACSGNPYRSGYPADGQWTVLPVTAARESTSIQIELLLTRALAEQGVANPRHPPASWISDQTKTLSDAHKLRNATQWAQQHGLMLGLTGVVDNWSRNHENRPQVTLTLKLLDIPSGTILWTTTGSGEGRSHDSVDDVAQRLIRTLLASLPIVQEPHSDTGWFRLPAVFVQAE